MDRVIEAVDIVNSKVKVLDQENADIRKVIVQLSAHIDSSLDRKKNQQ